MYIAMDGLDGAGKTTQQRNLASYLRSRGFAVRIIKLVELEIFRKAFTAMKTGEIPFHIVTWEYLHFFGSIMNDLEIISKRKPNEAIIADRHHLTYETYSVVNGIQPEVVKFFTKHLIRPDLYFYLDVSPEEALRRIRHARPSLALPEMGFGEQSLKTKGEEDAAFLKQQTKVRDRFLSKLDGNCIRIDAALREDEIHREMVAHVEERLLHDNSSCAKIR